MFNFYAVLAGHDTITEANIAAKFKAHHYKQKVEKTKDIPKTWVLMGKQFADFRRKKRTETLLSTFKKTQWDTRTLKLSIEYRPCKQ